MTTLAVVKALACHLGAIADSLMVVVHLSRTCRSVGYLGLLLH